MAKGILWDKTQNTWHTDVATVGRYSVRRLGKSLPYAAFLNNERLPISANASPEIVKAFVEERIRNLSP